MWRRLGKKSLHLLFFIYLILALTGSFVISISESFCVDYLNANKLDSFGFFSIINHNVDWLAEDTATIGNAYGNSFFPLYNGLLRALLFAGIPAAAICVSGSRFHLIKNDRISHLKNNILLKLRI